MVVCGLTNSGISILLLLRNRSNILHRASLFIFSRAKISLDLSYIQNHILYVKLIVAMIYLAVEKF